MFPLSYTYVGRYKSERPRAELLADVVDALHTNDRMEVELRTDEVWFRQRSGYARYRKTYSPRRTPVMYPDTGILGITGAAHDFTFTVTVGSRAQLLQSAAVSIVIVVALRI